MQEIRRDACRWRRVFQSFSIGSMIDLPTAIAAAHPDYTGKFIQGFM